jgi:hypothetical protein
VSKAKAPGIKRLYGGDAVEKREPDQVRTEWAMRDHNAKRQQEAEYSHLDGPLSRYYPQTVRSRFCARPSDRRPLRRPASRLRQPIGRLTIARRISRPRAIPDVTKIGNS